MGNIVSADIWSLLSDKPSKSNTWLSLEFLAHEKGSSNLLFTAKSQRWKKTGEPTVLNDFCVRLYIWITHKMRPWNHISSSTPELCFGWWSNVYCTERENDCGWLLALKCTWLMVWHSSLFPFRVHPFCFSFSLHSKVKSKFTHPCLRPEILVCT